MTSGILERASEVLEAMRRNEGRPVTPAELTRTTGIPRSSVHRILDQLVSLGWVTRDQNRYRMGRRLFDFGIGAAQSDSVMANAWPVVRDLAAESGHAVYLGAISGPDVVLLEKAEGRRGSGVPFRVGERVPAARTSLGKVLLSAGASSPDGAGAGFTIPAGRGALPPSSPAMECTRLREELRRVRDTGLALSRDELVRGVSCVGSAIRVRGAAVDVAIAIAGPSTVIGQRSTCMMIQMAAAAVGRRMEAAELGAASNPPDPRAMLAPVGRVAAR